MANTQHRPFRLPGEPTEEFEARMAAHDLALREASKNSLTAGPQWHNPGDPRAKEAHTPPKPRDYFAQARAALLGADQRDPIIAAMIVAQALDRLTDKIIEAAAVVNYKRST